MKLVNLGIAGGALVVCALCARHGIVQYVQWKSPDSRHFMQCAVAFIVGSVFAAIELGALHYDVMTPLLRLILGAIRNGILLTIIYHGVANLCIELVFKEGKIAQKRAMRRQLFLGWVCLSAVSIPYCLGREMRFYWVYSGVRFLLFVWYIFPTVLWYHRESLVAPTRVVGCRLNYLKRANFLGMLHPLAAFVTKVTACPLSLHLVLGLVMTLFFYVGYVTPKRMRRLMYRWFYPRPDAERLKYLAVVEAGRSHRNPSVLEVWMRQLGEAVDLAPVQIHWLVETIYLRGVAPVSTSSGTTVEPSNSSNQPHDTGSPDPSTGSEPALNEAKGPVLSGEFRSAHAADFIDEVLEYREVGHIVRYLSERWDGRGPYGLSGRAIPLESRVFSVVDAFVDELSRSSDEHAALQVIRARGTEFDPHLVAALERLVGGKGTAIKKRGGQR